MMGREEWGGKGEAGLSDKYDAHPSGIKIGRLVGKQWSSDQSMSAYLLGNHTSASEVHQNRSGMIEYISMGHRLV
jgi:hypothetical protein